MKSDKPEYDMDEIIIREFAKENAALKARLARYEGVIKWAENVLRHNCQCYACQQVRSVLASRETKEDGEYESYGVDEFGNQHFGPKRKPAPKAKE